VRKFLLWISLFLLLGGQSSFAATVDSHILPDFYNSSVPKYLTPTLTQAQRDFPKPYLDGCHTQQNMSFNRASCIYGNKNSKITIVLFGDSHALSWFPAVEKIALTKNWKLISLTMSSCWPASIPAWNSTTNSLMDNCSIWREGALKTIAKLKPKYIFVAGTSGFSTVDGDGNVLLGDQRQSAWTAGMDVTLKALTSASNKVFYIADYPVGVQDPDICLANSKLVGDCIKPLKKALDMDWLQLEQDEALNNGALFIDPTEWICQTDPCSPLDGKYVIYRDAGHLTATYAKTLFAPLYKQIKKQLV